LRQQVLVAKKQYEAALEMSERGRTRALTALLSRKRPAKAESLSTTPTVEKIKKIAKRQNATLVEYSIIPEDNFLHQGKLLGSGAELYIWVVKPTGKIEFRRINIESLDSPLEELVTIGRTCIIQHECRGNTNDLTPNVGDLVRLNNDEHYGFKAPWIVKKIDTESRIITVTHPTYDGDIEDEYSISDVVAIVDSPHAKKERLHQLHKLLIEPIDDLLPTAPESPIIFIPQGKLFLIPFSAIQDSEGKYLVQKHTIMTAPSIQVLDFTHKQRNARVGDNNLNSALVVGNPIMPTVPLQDSPLGELPKAEEEATNIAKLLNDQGITAQAITGSQATKVDILKQMPNAPLIHLATHGLLDDIKQLGVPGAIALAPSEGDNGFLTSGEILNLQLNAQLVVLSACDTGKGEITGDGVIGLSRSFIAAGVPSVVVSLWSVPDAPTGLLMTEFYRQFLTTGDKAQALRQAMLKIMKNPEYQNPVNWAAFTLIGESQ
jgi:CHAT domain-containing protein